jgi:hypothetical protein
MLPTEMAVCADRSPPPVDSGVLRDASLPFAGGDPGVLLSACEDAGTSTVIVGSEGSLEEGPDACGEVDDGGGGTVTIPTHRASDAPDGSTKVKPSGGQDSPRTRRNGPVPSAGRSGVMSTHVSRSAKRSTKVRDATRHRLVDLSGGARLANRRVTVSRRGASNCLPYPRPLLRSKAERIPGQSVPHECRSRSPRLAQTRPSSASNRLASPVGHSPHRRRLRKRHSSSQACCAASHSRFSLVNDVGRVPSA